MTDTSQRSVDDPAAIEPERLPTSYGGTNDVEPERPGQALGQAPDPDDAGVDEAGDRPGPGRGDPVGSDALDIDTSGATADPRR